VPFWFLSFWAASTEAKVQIPSLVVRGVGVGDVVGQDFGALGAKAQGLLMDTKRFIEADAHVEKPLWADLRM
jgi:hypothetical protein